MDIIVVGLNHKTATVDLREKVSFDRDGAAEALARSTEIGLCEAVVLSTCNRSEVYGVVDHDPLVAQRAIGAYLAARAGVAPESLDEHLYRLQGEGAVSHLVRVAAGLDSLVLGEPQILGQVRDAFEAGQAAGTVHTILSRLFLTAIEAGKKVRTDTGLGSMPVSVASISIQLAERVFGPLSDASVLVVGAGETCRAAAMHVSSRDPRRLVVINRTASRAEELAVQCRGEAVAWDRLTESLCASDLVLIGTGATEPVITAALLHEVMERRNGRHLLLIDLGVPRDVEPAGSEVDNVYLFDIDDLEQIADEHMRQRLVEVPRATQVAESACAKFLAWKSSLDVVPTIVELRAQLEDIRRSGVQQFIGKFPDLDERGRKCLEQMTQTIVNRILHQPQLRLKNPPSSMSSAVLAGSIRYLFALDATDDGR